MSVFRAIITIALDVAVVLVLATGPFFRGVSCER